MGTVTPITPVNTEKQAEAAPQAVEETMPSIEELLARNRQLEAEKAEALEQAAGYKDQVQDLINRKPVPAEMATTTTKPVWPFHVDGPNGPFDCNVVDESEAKRLYCVKFRIDPSVGVLKVTCTAPGERKAAIEKQYIAAGVSTERIPGVNLGV